MNNKCVVCNATVDVQWSSLQNKIKETADLSQPLNLGFVERCIYCYKTLVELTEQRETEWYQEVMRAVEKRFKW